MNEKLADLFNRIKADGNLLTVSEAQTSQGIHKNQGFHPIENLNYSWQNRDTNRTIKYVIKLAKLLGAEIYVLFEWEEKGKFPMKKGVINWKP